MDYVPDLMEKANGIAEKTIDKNNKDKIKVQQAPKNKILRTVKNVAEELNNDDDNDEYLDDEEDK